jgi:hypothetical protein
MGLTLMITSQINSMDNALALNCGKTELYFRPT